MKAELKHLKTITIHKYLVTKYCFKSGLYIQGLKHDLTKYGPTEFRNSAKYFQGNRSPLKYLKDTYGYSIAWQHHKGHNPHHWEYWIDWKDGEEYIIRMPLNYAYEFICDYIAAGKAYNKGTWHQGMPLQYYTGTFRNMRIHPETNVLLSTIFTDIATYGPDYACRKMRERKYQYSDSGNFIHFVV